MDRNIKDEFGVDEAQLEIRDIEYENESWTGPLGPVTPGRPDISNESFATITVRLPQSRINAMDAVARRLSLTRSQFLREAIDEKLLRPYS